jgi:hypothetical protein
MKNYFYWAASMVLTIVLLNYFASALIPLPHMVGAGLAALHDSFSPQQREKIWNGYVWFEHILPFIVPIVGVASIFFLCPELVKDMWARIGAKRKKSVVQHPTK